MKPMGYLMKYYSKQGKMPLFIQEVYDGVRLRQSLHVAPAFQIPTQLPQNHPTAALRTCTRLAARRRFQNQ
jgi:hypothetical protein